VELEVLVHEVRSDQTVTQSGFWRVPQQRCVISQAHKRVLFIRTCLIVIVQVNANDDGFNFQYCMNKCLSNVTKKVIAPYLCFSDPAVLSYLVGRGFSAASARGQGSRLRRTSHASARVTAPASMSVPQAQGRTRLLLQIPEPPRGKVQGQNRRCSCSLSLAQSSSQSNAGRSSLKPPHQI
jgi:hypothetical protein